MRSLWVVILLFFVFALWSCGGTDKLDDLEFVDAEGNISLLPSASSTPNPPTPEGLRGVKATSPSYNLRSMYLGYSIQKASSDNYKAKTNVGGFLSPVEAKSANYQLKHLSRLNEQD